ncbi:M15 family metallopeptidase [Patulibacter brassicae]|uniref:M15 family metallopeptidase n=1 Tax=Patulibacter brassicae TaxID=1705717 RepID=A0ABU4VLA3_9ACTN|nr:M15 family metallopeptidase [Patulibacter brassicae]MDX8151711.1 M15 family metallopeptidase [Patulibacter brassicae]
MPSPADPRSIARRRRGTRLAVAAIAGATGVAALGHQLASSAALPTATAALAPLARRAAPPSATAAPAGTAGLAPGLRRALRRAASDAAGAGLRLSVTSGRRTPEHQRRLLREAIARYGSATEAARWVATPETSAHVSGDAVDIGPAAAWRWLGDHGSRYGLCRIYDNEPWHFELRPAAAQRGCPATYADPTHDPRMHR